MSVAPIPGPPQQTMADAFLPQCQSLFLAQTSKGCFQELLGCDDTSEFFIYEGPAKQQHLYTLTEHSHICWRLQMGHMRPFTMEFTNADKSVKYATFNRPIRCAPGAFCCQQEIQVEGSVGQNLGRAYMPFFCCLPTVNTETATGETKYSAEYSMWDCSLDIPFLIKDAATGQPLAGSPQLGNAVIKKEFPRNLNAMVVQACTSVDEFSINFPIGASLDDKFSLIAAAVLLDYTFFEAKKENGEH